MASILGRTPMVGDRCRAARSNFADYSRSQFSTQTTGRDTCSLDLMVELSRYAAMW